MRAGNLLCRVTSARGDKATKAGPKAVNQRLKNAGLPNPVLKPVLYCISSWIARRSSLFLLFCSFWWTFIRFIGPVCTIHPARADICNAVPDYYPFFFWRRNPRSPTTNKLSMAWKLFGSKIEKYHNLGASWSKTTFTLAIVSIY